MFEINGKYTTAKVMIDNVDPETMKQITIMSSHPAVTNPVAIMPDCHKGSGCVIGFTMKCGEKVVPNFVGVDIGCGMLSVKTALKSISNDNLAAIDREIRNQVPMGKATNDATHANFKMGFASDVKLSLHDIEDIIDKVGVNESRFWNSLGSLGGGNHFLEMGIDDTAGNVWITVHSGSRNFGKRVCEYFDDMAQHALTTGAADAYVLELKAKVARGELDKTQIGSLYQKYKQEHKLTFDVKESAYLEGQHLKDYLFLMNVAQKYAVLNRQMIIRKVLVILAKQLSIQSLPLPEVSIETIHNYISPEDGMIRKGAVASYTGRLMVIPFNMRDGLLICEGKSNPEWNYSAPHGAGRVLSRRQAKDKILLEDYKESMAGIFTTSVGTSTLDESPMAYKDAAMIEAAIDPTAKIIHRVKPIYNVKAGDES